MGLFKLTRKDFYICDRSHPHNRRERFDQFNSSVLGLGDLKSPTRAIEAIAVVFDLAGFTKFCAQIDPHLAVSEYLSAFLDWLFGMIKRKSCVDEEDAKPGASKKKRSKKKIPDEGTVPTFTTLPFFAKFMGDGVLFLWDAQGLTENTICCVPSVMTQVCAGYEVEFLPKIALNVADPPPQLRCGIARGKVFSVGNGEDFVGPCINMASRLQKLSSIQIAFSRRGFNADKYMDKHMRGHFVLKKISVRGIGGNELVYIDDDSFRRLPDSEKASFEDPDEDWRAPTEEELKESEATPIKKPRTSG